MQSVRVKAEEELYLLEEKFAEATKVQNEAPEEDQTKSQIDEVQKQAKDLEEKLKLEREMAELRLKYERAEMERIRAEKKREEKTRKIIVAQRNLNDQKKEIEGCSIL
jgi:hypothetical protein